MAKNIVQIEDANGKKLSIDMAKVCDINGDMGEEGFSSSVSDSQKNRVAHVHDVEYVDQSGQTIDALQLMQDMASGKTKVLALDVEMEATHSGRNHNYCIYYEDSMEKDAESFVNPFTKPVLKNHNSYSGEPMGRILQSYYGPSALTDERSAIHLKARITDAEAIPKFLDGRYKTVSIGGTMGSVTCNICGKHILKDGKFKFCGHWKGETYKDQVCYWGARDIEYHEVSTVNNPADDYAQIMKVTVVTDSDKNNEEKKNHDNKEEAKMQGKTTEDAKSQICDIIDQILAKTSDNNDPAPAASEDSTQAKAAEDNTQEPAKQEDSVDAKDDVEKMKKELEDAKAANEELQKELNETKDSLEKAQKDLTEAQDESKSYQEKCMTLAAANKELVVDSVILKEIGAGKIEEGATDSRKEELLAMSMKDLNQLAATKTTEDSKEEPKQREQANVKNPTLANNEDSNGSADTNKATDNEKAQTLEDFTNDIVGKLFK